MLTMGRKKKKPIKPWCWYCNREFDDDKILVQHQRAKHYKCPFCHKKLYSGPGLTVHCIQVHKEKLDRIPEALPNRNSVDIDIYGMQGVPEEDLREHERAKRGDEGPSKSEPEAKSQQAAKSSRQTAPLLPPASSAAGHMAQPNPMQAGMFQQAMSMGVMPPGFLMPMGMPPMFPPGFMPPPGVPFSSAAPMLPNLQMSGPTFGMSSMLPPTSLSSAVGGHFPPPPPPPPGMNVPPPPPSPPPPPGRESSSSQPSLPPPPMSGVGHLIGIPPPKFNPSQASAPTLPQSAQPATQRLLPIRTYDNDTRTVRDQQSHQQPPPSRSQHPEQSKEKKSKVVPLIPPPPATSAVLIAKPAVIKGADTTGASRPVVGSEDFIDVPSLNARIMHPNKDLSLEEIRLSLSKYSKFVKSNTVDA